MVEQATVLKKTRSISRPIYDASLIRRADEITFAKFRFVERVHLFKFDVLQGTWEFPEVGDQNSGLVASLFFSPRILFE